MTRAGAALLLAAALAGCGRKPGAATAAHSVPPAPLAGSAGAHAPPLGAGALYREIRDWILACDNGATCTLKAVPDESASALAVDDLGSMTVTREAGPGGKLTVSLDVDGDGAVDTAHLALDGRPLPAFPGWRAGELTDDAALRFLRAVRDGRVLRVGAGAKPSLISLNGLAAVLLAVDEAQGRLGFADALARPGARPASAAPPAPALPVVTAGPTPAPLPDPARFAAAVRTAHRAELDAAGCDTGADPDRAQEDDAAALSAGEALVVLACSMAAYQGSSLVFRAPRGAPGRAKLLVTPPDPKGVADDGTPGDGQITEAAFEPTTLTLSTSAKGRGIADCGDSRDWTFDGRDFRLVAATRQDRCGGGGPGDWPTVWRSVVRRR